MKLKDLVKKANITPDSNGSVRCKTPVFRSSYAFVFEPKETPNGDMKYSISMIFSKEDQSQLKPVIQCIANAAAKKFGSNPDKWPVNMKCPIRDGDEEREAKEYKNAVFLNAGNKNQPGIVDRQMQPILSSDEFYSGCYARASISFYPYDQAGNKGVGCGLNNLLKWDEGERLDGAVAAEDDFKEFAEETEAQTSNDVDDDSPF